MKYNAITCVAGMMVLGRIVDSAGVVVRLTLSARARTCKLIAGRQLTTVAYCESRDAMGNPEVPLKV